MSAFKDALLDDIHTTFLDIDEFADMHVIDGRKMPALIDNTQSIERSHRFNQSVEGAGAAQTLLQVAASDFGAFPTRGVTINLDGLDYVLTNAVDEDGMFVLTLSATEPIGRRRLP